MLNILSPNMTKAFKLDIKVEDLRDYWALPTADFLLELRQRCAQTSSNIFDEVLWLGNANLKKSCTGRWQV